MKIDRAKKFAGNPRRITNQQRVRLADHLAELGDLSGVVFCRNAQAYVGGNQRSDVFHGAEIELTERYDEPTANGTTAHGFIKWNGQALPAAEAQTEMKTAGFTPYATRQACERLGIKPFKRGYQPSVWMWQLPVEDVEDSLEDVENNNLRHLRVNADTKASYGNSLVEDVEGLFSSTSSTSSTSSDNDTKASYGNSLVEDVEGLVSSTSSDSNLEREVYTI